MSDQIHEELPVGSAVQPANVWAALRQEREAKGMSLHQVSAQLKLTVRQLEAIECGDLSVLPGATFARGFVRNYARFLGLDPAVFLSGAEGQEGRPAGDIPEQMITPSLGRMPSSGNPGYSALPAAAMVLVVALVLGAGWYYGWFESREDMALLNAPVEQSAPEMQPDAMASAPEVASSMPLPEASAVPAAPVSAPSPAMSAPALAQSAPLVVQAQPQAAMSRPSVASVPVSAQSAPVPRSPQLAPPSVLPVAASSLPRMVLGFDGDSWLEVRDGSGKIVFSRLNQAGSVQEVQGTPPFELVIGNATKVRLNWKGKPVDLAPSIKGDVARVSLQ